MIFRRTLGGALTLLAVGAAPAAAQFSPGAPGAGDPFFPSAGNGGYDVRNYDVDLNYEPQNEQLDGDVTITARATQDLSSFNLDLRGFKISSLTVNGAAASFARKDQELTVTPAAGLSRNRNFTVRVVYAGHANYVLDPDHSKDGWIPTDDGAFVVNEPQGSPTWIPVNDTTRDFATWDFSITVPKGLTAMGNGTLVSHTDTATTSTWRWRESKPMVSYLTTVTNGNFELRTGSIDGIPQYDAVDPQTRRFGQKNPEPQLAWSRLGVEPEAVRFLSGLYGPYPFDSVGAIVDYAPNVFYSLESQTKPNYWVVPSIGTIVHEIAHQWFGDALVLERWPDMWLNEGFATWSEWIWFERHNGPSAHEQFVDLYDTPEDSPAGEDLWFPAPNALPDASVLFATPVYDRGAMTLQALREKIGNDDTFLNILRTWYGENRYSNVTTAEFIATAERVSGLDLDHFFDVWLFQEGKPTSW